MTDQMSLFAGSGTPPPAWIQGPVEHCPLSERLASRAWLLRKEHEHLMESWREGRGAGQRPKEDGTLDEWVAETEAKFESRLADELFAMHRVAVALGEPRHGDPFEATVWASWQHDLAPEVYAGYMSSKGRCMDGKRKILDGEPDEVKIVRCTLNPPDRDDHDSRKIHVKLRKVFVEDWTGEGISFVGKIDGAPILIRELGKKRWHLGDVACALVALGYDGVVNMMGSPYSYTVYAFDGHADIRIEEE